MSETIVTVFEPTPAASIEALRSISDQTVGIEIRADRWGAGPPSSETLASIRSASTRTMIYTRRSSDAGRTAD
ncbi:MAG TPA: hypothetical protein VM534_07940, partial [Thermoanaerobaculia bacterium]|nr:hypothetical protein [Thermoanaerobaculia bacterium]